MAAERSIAELDPNVPYQQFMADLSTTAETETVREYMIGAAETLRGAVASMRRGYGEVSYPGQDDMRSIERYIKLGVQEKLPQAYNALKYDDCRGEMVIDDQGRETMVGSSESFGRGFYRRTLGVDVQAGLSVPVITETGKISEAKRTTMGVTFFHNAAYRDYPCVKQSLGIQIPATSEQSVRSMGHGLTRHHSYLEFDLPEEHVMRFAALGLAGAAQKIDKSKRRRNQYS